jgi:acetyl esterase/lipase
MIRAKLVLSTLVVLAFSLMGTFQPPASAAGKCSTRAAAGQGVSAPTATVAYRTGSAARADLTSLDIYQPPGGGPRPILMFVHGGGWAIGDRRHDGSKADRFTAEGYLYISINYRLAPAVSFPAYPDDVGAAIAWVHHNAATYGGDPNCIFLMGHSAGAHLVALVATDERYMTAHGLDLTAIKGGIALDGAGYNIPAHMEDARRAARQIYERAFGTDPKVWAEASPITYITAGKPIPPFLLFYVGRRPDSRARSLELAELLTKAGYAAQAIHAPDKTHLSLNRQLGQRDDVPTRQILDWLAEQTA